ncbi:hypothetical protein [Clostridium botulinum]|uniref:hypothetical protein n=1 Tax=Clostridium botulinum TaxID=1491 RepID=UPI001C9A9C13|nr:hypothetical protein [Clostridium botulinum]MBY6842782.1 hypothetical protein [Clostridium botulinum]
MDYKYNEKLYGEVLYNNGFQTNYIKSELVILIKYLKQIKGLSKKDTEKFIYNFCEKYLEGFNKVQYFRTIDSAIQKGRRCNNKLIIIENIPILKSELEYIDGLEVEHEYKKLLLAFIVHKKINLEIHRLIDENAKLSAYFGGSNKKYREVFKTANVSNKYKINDMINELVNRGIIKSIIKGDIILDYMYSIYDIIEKEVEVKNKITHEINKEIRKTILYKIEYDDIYERITNFDNIGYIFDYYKGVDKIKKCDNCGDYIKQKSNKSKYCLSCAREILQEQKNKWKREKWNKINKEEK